MTKQFLYRTKTFFEEYTRSKIKVLEKNVYHTEDRRRRLILFIFYCNIIFFYCKNIVFVHCLLDTEQSADDCGHMCRSLY